MWIFLFGFCCNNSLLLLVVIGCVFVCVCLRSQNQSNINNGYRFSIKIKANKIIWNIWLFVKWIKNFEQQKRELFLSYSVYFIFELGIAWEKLFSDKVKKLRIAWGVRERGRANWDVTFAGSTARERPGGRASVFT
jgi:hypothetical protein